MRSRVELESQLVECRKRLGEAFFGSSDEHMRYWRRRVDFLEWVLGTETPLMTLQERPQMNHITSSMSAKMNRGKSLQH